jgi:hypothetical protein
VPSKTIQNKSGDGKFLLRERALKQKAPPPILQTGERATNSEEKVVFLSYYFFWVQIQFPNTENGNNQKAKGK